MLNSARAKEIFIGVHLPLVFTLYMLIAKRSRQMKHGNDCRTIIINQSSTSLNSLSIADGSEIRLSFDHFENSYVVLRSSRSIFSPPQTAEQPIGLDDTVFQPGWHRITSEV